jgi:hypothetical protein
LVEDVVAKALRRAIERDTEFRLVSIGEAPDETGLFADRKGAARKGIQECLDGEKPLLSLREEPGKGKTPTQFVCITDKGIATLASRTPLKQFPELIAAAAPLLKTRIIRSCLRSLARRSGELDPWSHRRLVQSCLTATQGQFDAIDGRLQDVLKEGQTLFESINDFLSSTRTRFENQKQRLSSDLDSLSRAAGALVSPTDTGTSGGSHRPQLPEWQRVATSDPEIDFQRNLGAELVFAWQDTDLPSTREALERALFNVGVERLNAPGDIVELDSTSHHTEDEVAEGELVEVVLPGWKLVTPRGSSLLARGRVKKATGSAPPEQHAQADAEGENVPKVQDMDRMDEAQEKSPSEDSAQPSGMDPGTAEDASVSSTP